jgi:uncharacterized membrane protein
MMEKGVCFICSRQLPISELIQGHGIRYEIEELIKEKNPGWDDSKLLCWNDYFVFRDAYIKSIIEEETGKLKDLDHEVMTSIRDNELVSENINTSSTDQLTLGDRVADRVASFGGSWTFITIFFLVLIAWIVINSSFLIKKPFDPYPFILMNLILSCIAAIQAPVIMMSQNRQEDKDRMRAENDYKVNLKAEIEIRTLHEKVDHLLLDQWSRMMKIQELQIEMLEEIREKVH